MNPSNEFSADGDVGSTAGSTDATGVDAPMARRPGVPAERRPEPVGGARWRSPAKQEVHGVVLKDVDRRELTATFGSGEPPRGLSGLLRRVAYDIPDYRARRWLLLIVADRIDAVEGDLELATKSPWAWVALGAALAGLAIPSIVSRRKPPVPTRWERVARALGPRRLPRASR